MKTAKAWIFLDENTGNTLPWEVRFQVEGFPMRKAASCSTKEKAAKSLASLIKRNSAHYQIEG